jgi:hypothetical protein
MAPMFQPPTSLDEALRQAAGRGTASALRKTAASPRTHQLQFQAGYRSPHVDHLRLVFR